MGHKFTNLGFTGTRAGMTPAQRFKVRSLTHRLNPKRVHHGACVGADAEFHEIVRELSSAIVLYPAFHIGHKYRAKCAGGIIDSRFVDRFPLPDPLQRNRIIVAESSALIAAPSTMSEVLRSGTWATVRYARQHGIKIIIVWPTGALTKQAS